MKLNLSLLKLIIRLLILLILFVILFMISAFLYSSRFWPDIYNYVNANITIKRIPTISELNITIISVPVYDMEYTTEIYSTTDGNTDSTDVFDDFSGDFDEFFIDRKRREVKIEEMNKDYSELPKNVVVNYVFTYQEPTEILRDLVDEEKLTTSDSKDFEMLGKGEEFQKIEEMKKDYSELPKNVVINSVFTYQEPTELLRDLVDEEKLTKSASKNFEMIGKVEEFQKVEKMNKDYSESPKNVAVNSVFTYQEPTEILRDLVDEVKLTKSSSKDEMIGKGVEELQKMISGGNEIVAMLPWIATIFIKNGSTDQFEYTCDGALLSTRVILTAGRCVTADTAPALNPENFIIILGKRSLVDSTQYERVHKVKQLILHSNFSSENEENDLAVLILEEATTISYTIQPACLDYNGTHDGSVEAITSGWAINGNLTVMSLQRDNTETCANKAVVNTFCATYGNNVSTCPSYGGLYAIKKADKTCIQGIRHGNPANRGFCIDRNVLYTSLDNYIAWINDILSTNKD